MNMTHSVSSHNNNYRLINFNVPNYLIHNFDNLVKFKRVSRTSMLLRLMEKYIRTEKEELEKDNSLNVMLNDISQRTENRVKKQLKDDFEPPMIPYSSDDFNWEDRFK